MKKMRTDSFLDYDEVDASADAMPAARSETERDADSRDRGASIAWTLVGLALILGSALLVMRLLSEAARGM